MEGILLDLHLIVRTPIGSRGRGKNKLTKGKKREKRIFPRPNKIR